MEQDWTYDGIASRADVDKSFREGLRAAAAVARAQGHDDASKPPCPASMVAVYVDTLADGQIP